MLTPRTRLLIAQLVILAAAALSFVGRLPVWVLGPVGVGYFLFVVFLIRCPACGDALALQKGRGLRVLKGDCSSCGAPIS